MDLIKRRIRQPIRVAFFCTAIGVTFGVIAGQGLAPSEPPTEHSLLLLGGTS